MCRAGFSISWLNSLALFTALLATGCGFEPLYARKKASTSPIAGVIVVDTSAADSRMGQQLRIALENSLNPEGGVADRPQYRLSVAITSSQAAIGVAPDGAVSRYNVYLYSHYTLFRLSDSKPMTTGTLQHVSGYSNITNAYFSAFAAEQDAIKQGVGELSELYRERMVAYLTSPYAGRPDATIAQAGNASATPPTNPFPGNPYANIPFSTGSSVSSPFANESITGKIK